MEKIKKGKFSPDERNDSGEMFTDIYPKTKSKKSVKLPDIRYNPVRSIANLKEGFYLQVEQITRSVSSVIQVVIVDREKNEIEVRRYFGPKTISQGRVWEKGSFRDIQEKEKEGDIYKWNDGKEIKKVSFHDLRYLGIYPDGFPIEEMHSSYFNCFIPLEASGPKEALRKARKITAELDIDLY